MKSTKRTTALITLFAIGLALPAAADVKIGVLIPESGPAGLFGPSARQAATLAALEINESGGINGEPIELVFADVGGAPAAAVQSAIRLWRGENVEGFVGMHDSAVREALIGQFKAQVPYVYTPVYEGGECAPGTWVTGETPAQQLGPVIPWITEQEGVKSWYLIGNDYVWGRGTNAAARQLVEGLGNEVVGEEYVPLGTSDYDASLQRIRASGADAVLVSLVGGDAVSFNISYGTFGLDEQAVRLGTMLEENTLAGIGEAGSSRMFSSMGFFSNIGSDVVTDFSARLSSEFGDEAAVMNTLGESTYDGLVLLATIANKAGSLDVAAMSEVADGTEISSPRGKVVLNGNHTARTIYVADATGGSFNVVAEFDNVDAGGTCD
jgi:ABC-type branched-subunit amino acid transport system substrate-binding protein